MGYVQPLGCFVVDLLIHILDVEIHHLEMPHELKFTNVKVSENGPVRASVVAEIKYGKSTIKTTARYPFHAPTGQCLKQASRFRLTRLQVD
jgi:hypothetical protein